MPSIGLDQVYLKLMYIMPSMTVGKLDISDRHNAGYYIEDETKVGFASFGLDGPIIFLPTNTNIAYYDPNES